MIILSASIQIYNELEEMIEVGWYDVQGTVIDYQFEVEFVIGMLD